MQSRTYTLENGLSIVLHENKSSTMVTVQVLYHVGSADEPANQTGLAHLCEHLMFGASLHVPCYDTALQQVGGENNAYTTKDVTAYHCTLPANNLSTGLWLESDRMLGLKLTQTQVDIQKKVVIEEFKECYLNQPYGDIWLHLLPLVYDQHHPYHWPTIGKNIADIKKISLQDIQKFFSQYYTPENATLVIAGNFHSSQTIQECKKWFSDIPSKNKRNKKTIAPNKTPIAQTKHLTTSVPKPALFMAFQIPGVYTQIHDHLALFASVLNNQSSTFYQTLIYQKQSLSSLSVYLLDDFSAGLFIIEGYSHGLANDLSSLVQSIQMLILEEVNTLKMTLLQGIKNKKKMQWALTQIDMVSMADALAMGSFWGNVNACNEKILNMQMVGVTEIQLAVKKFLRPENCTTILYG